MRLLFLISEAEGRVHFTKDELLARHQALRQERAEAGDKDTSWVTVEVRLEKDGLHLGPQGKINYDIKGGVSGYRADYRPSVLLNPDTRAIYRGAHQNFYRGGKVLPAENDILRMLMDHGIIDDSWEIKDSSFGHRSGREWVDSREETSGLPVAHAADPQNRLSRTPGSLTLYHGTSSVDWVTIQQQGLLPLGTEGVEPGQESRARGEGNEGVVYLCGTMKEALRYAEQRARDVARRKGARTDWDIEAAGILPVVLSVQIDDTDNLVADDDPVNRIARDWAYRLWKRKTPEEQRGALQRIADKGPVPVSLFGVTMGMHELDVEQTMRDPSIAVMYWRESDEGHAEIMRRIPNRIRNTWYASLMRENQVGHRGPVPPEKLSVVIPKT